MDLMIRTEDLWKCYEDCSEHGTEALRGLDIEVPRGETAALLGRSGPAGRHRASALAIARSPLGIPDRYAAVRI